MLHRQVLRFANPYRAKLLLIGLFMIGSSVATLAIPWLAGQLLGGFVSNDESSLHSPLGLIIAVLVLLSTLNFAVAWISGTTGARILADVRMALYEHLQALPLSFHEGHRQGDLLALMTYEVARLSQFLTGTLVSVLPLLVTVTGAVILMFRIDPALALLVPLLVPAFYFILKVVGRRLRGLARDLQQAEAHVVSVAEEDLEMLPAIKAFTREVVEAASYSAAISRAMELNQQQSKIFAALQPVIGLLAATGAVLLLYYGGRNVHTGALATSELFSFLLYAALLTRPVAQLADVYGQVQSVRGTLEHLDSVLRVPVEPGHAVGLALERPSAGKIIFEGVGFAYPGRDPTLSDANLKINAGETIALTGPNGAGKTTLIKLLLRYYEVNAGRVCLDGRNIAELNVRDLRRQIGYVPQRALLFNGTIRENISFGLQECTEGQVIHAARLAQAYEFILALPDGFETMIGDHGVRLSGGQRQRIALARAFVKNPPILVLDEATSMYDLEGETALVAQCAAAFRGRTVILITHRPASLSLADRVFVVEGGQVREISSASSDL